MDTMTMPAPRTLIADDHPDVLAALDLLLRNEGWQAEMVTSPAAVLDALAERDYDLLLMDLNYTRDTTSGREGLDLLSRIHSLDSTLPVVAMTAWGSIELAVEAMQQGVVDFVQKPWENSRLLKVLSAQIQAGRERRRDLCLRAALERSRAHELSTAREIQQGLLPQEVPTLAGCEIATAWQTAREVGGDYFDVLQFDDRYAALCIGDASGKGMPAALMMSNVQAMVRATAAANVSPRELCLKINQAMCHNLTEGRFITFIYGLLDTVSRRFLYANAGHNAPMLVRRDGTSRQLTMGGTVLGIVAGGDYPQEEIKLEPGDHLLFFTDGVTEVTNAAGEEFGEWRLLSLLTRYRNLSVAALREKIMAAVTAFSDGDFHDDATLIVLACEK
ncbi:MAG TPA: SpoIIE family protein phosphatase [Blastocatellia bacterium]|nr:SpoIIE family protein phosphatase [Blastocatellia bacterium]